MPPPVAPRQAPPRRVSSRKGERAPPEAGPKAMGVSSASVAVLIPRRFAREYRRRCQMPRLATSRNATMAAHSEQPLLARFTPLVLLKYGTGDPLFIVHGLGGAVAELAPLGRLMPSLRPVYAIQARGVDGDEPPFDSLVDMANYYLDNLKDVQPRGALFAGGVFLRRRGRIRNGPAARQGRRKSRLARHAGLLHPSAKLAA